MIRKLLMVAAAAAVPMGAIAVGAVGGGVAGAATPISANPVTCAMGGTVTFGAPGISLVGVTTGAKDGVTTATTSFSSCTGGTITAAAGTLTITTKNTKCVAPFPAVPTALGTSAATSCAKKRLITDSGGGLGSAGTFKSLGKALKPLGLALHEAPNNFSLKVKALPYPATNEILPGGACGATEVGFSIPLTVKTSPKSTLPGTGQITVCLGTDNNAGPNNSFFSDLTAGHTIPSTQIDTATSSITIG